MARYSDRLVQRSGRPVREEVGAISGSVRRSANETTTGEGSALHQLRAAVEKTTNQAENSCLMALDAAQHYNAKLFEFCKGNNDAALNYAQELADATSPSEFIQITTRNAAAQIELLDEQARELVTLGQTIVSKSVERFKR
jgi:hypothetical protein